MQAALDDDDRAVFDHLENCRECRDRFGGLIFADVSFRENLAQASRVRESRRRALIVFSAAAAALIGFAVLWPLLLPTPPGPIERPGVLAPRSAPVVRVERFIVRDSSWSGRGLSVSSRTLESDGTTSTKRSFRERPNATVLASHGIIVR